MPPIFSLPPETTRKLDALVDKIEANPGEFFDPSDLPERPSEFDVKSLLSNLPRGLSENDLVGILRLAFLTESATESYARAIDDRARQHGATWLSRFNTRVWTPDEMTHHTPYKYILMSLGFSEEELDREVRETREREYHHSGGETPVHITTFGMVQEYLTDRWHGLIAKLLRPVSPAAYQAVTLIKRRETLHTIWYRDMVALQIEGNPRLVEHISEELMWFRMPGSSLLPELQGRSNAWLDSLGTDSEHLVKDILRLVYETLGDTRLAGQMVLGFASAKGYSLGPLSARQLTRAINRLGGPGYGLLGEALLERAGLGYLFELDGGGAAAHRESAVLGRVRGALRSWVGEQLALRSDWALNPTK